MTEKTGVCVGGVSYSGEKIKLRNRWTIFYNSTGRSNMKSVFIGALYIYIYEKDK